MNCRSFLNCLAASGLWLVLATGAMAQSTSVTIGESTLTLPHPKGQAPLEGELTETQRAAVVSLGNRVLAVYQSTDGQSGIPALFHAQTPRGTESVTASIEQFQEMKGMLQQLLGGDAEILADDEHSVHFASEMELVLEEQEEAQMATIITAMCNVAGKAINLYAIVPNAPDTNQAWAHEQIVQWQEALLAANPASVHDVPVKKAVSPVMQGALIGSLALLIGAFGWLRRGKGKKEAC